MFHIAHMMHIAHWNNKSSLYYFADHINAFSQLDSCYEPNKCFFPQISEFQRLAEEYPNALFIMMHRNVKDHIASINNWKRMRERIINGEIPSLPAGKGELDQELSDWITGHYRNVTSYFKSTAPDRFLTYDLNKDNVEKLKGFLQCYDQDYIMPHLNNTKLMQQAQNKSS